MEPISKEEEAVLFKEFQSDNEDALSQIIKQFQPLAMHFLKRFIGTNRKYLQQDVQSDIHLILWRAAENYDMAKGNRFSSYLRKCVLNEVTRKNKAGRKESKCIERYWNEIGDGAIKDFSSDGDCEVFVRDSFACRDEPILAELTPFCKGKNQKRLVKLICTDDGIWYKNGRVNYAAIGQRLGTSREAVRQMIFNLCSNQDFKSTLCQLIPR